MYIQVRHLILISIERGLGRDCGLNRRHMESTSIPLDTLRDYIEVSSSNKVILILDSCFSGAAGEAFTKSGVDDQLQLASGGRGIYIMSASTGI
jgi:hypothetical protein